MKNIYKLLILLVVGGATFTACESDIPESPALIITTPEEVQQNLIGGKWYLEEYKFTDGVKDSVQTQTLSDCQKQSYLSFVESVATANADYTLFDACSNVATPAKYTLNYSGAIMTFNIDGGNKAWTVSFDESKQKMFLDYIAGSGRFVKSQTRTYIRK